MPSIISLLVVLALSILVTRVATVALTYTGLSREFARFQSRSAFTGVCFTTGESENVVKHRLRRNILMLLMLLGSAGVITAVSSLIVSFVNVEGSTTLNGRSTECGTIKIRVNMWANHLFRFLKTYPIIVYCSLFLM